jgi:hypothetical protein
MPIPVDEFVLFSGTSGNKNHQNKAYNAEGNFIQNHCVFDTINNCFG